MTQTGLVKRSPEAPSVLAWNSDTRTPDYRNSPDSRPESENVSSKLAGIMLPLFLHGRSLPRCRYTVTSYRLRPRSSLE